MQSFVGMEDADATREGSGSGEVGNGCDGDGGGRGRENAFVARLRIGMCVWFYTLEGGSGLLWGGCLSWGLECLGCYGDDGGL